MQPFDNIEYGDFYKFIVSGSAAISIAASFALTTKLELTIFSPVNLPLWPWLFFFVFIAGIVLFFWGCFEWKKKQDFRDDQAEVYWKYTNRLLKKELDKSYEERPTPPNVAVETLSRRFNEHSKRKNRQPN